MSCPHEGGVQVSVGFWILTIWFATVNGWRLTAVLLGMATVHEAGHWLVLKAAGGRAAGLRIGILGAVMEVDSRGLSYGKELLVVLAGPAANLLTAAVCAGAGAETAAGAGLILGAFNLLPIRPLDGGRALELGFSWALGPTAGETAARWAGTAAAAVLAGGLAMVMLQSGGSLWLLPMALSALAAVKREGFRKKVFCKIMLAIRADLWYSI